MILRELFYFDKETIGAPEETYDATDDESVIKKGRYTKTFHRGNPNTVLNSSKKEIFAEEQKELDFVPMYGIRHNPEI